MRITCGNLKGGVGKTTSAAFIACGLARSGRVLLVDADPYGSLVDWSEADGFPATVIPWSSKDLARRVEGVAGDYDHVVIDTAPNHEHLLRGALACSDVLVIPCSPTILDVERLSPTLDLADEVATLRPHLQARILFTRTNERSSDLRDAREGLTEGGLPVMTSHIRSLVHYSRSRNSVPSDLADYEGVLYELHELTSAVAS